MNPVMVPGLLERCLPGLWPRLQIERELWRDATGKDLGPDAFLGWVVVPYAVEVLTKGGSPEQELELRKLFTILEELMGDENPAVPNLVVISFCEALMQHSEAFQAALEYMGPETRDASLELLGP